jgi:hypothetical protein
LAFDTVLQLEIQNLLKPVLFWSLINLSKKHGKGQGQGQFSPRNGFSVFRECV